jgi:hypothetical protein
LLAAGSEAEKRRNLETKSTAVICMVHLSYVEIVAKKGENCHQKARYDQNLPRLLELVGAWHCLQPKISIKSQGKPH